MNLGGLIFLSGFFLLSAFWIGALIDAGTTPHEPYARANLNKGMVMLLIVFTGWFGSVYWFAVMRRRVKR